MQLSSSTPSLPIRSKLGPHTMAGVELPSISMHILLTPPHTPNMPSMLPSCPTLYAHTSQLPIRPPNPRYGDKPTSDQRTDTQDLTKGNTGQRLPPISQILADVPAPNGKHPGPCAPVFPGGLPTPSLSPGASFHTCHDIRFPGLDAYANPTPPQSRQPSLTDLRLFEHPQDGAAHPCQDIRFPGPDAPGRPRHRQPSPGQCTHYKARVESNDGFEMIYHPKEEMTRPYRRQRSISPLSTDASDSDFSDYVVIKKTTKSPIRKTKNTSTKNDGRRKRSNDTYNFVESLFIIYHTVDRGLPWAETESLFKKQFPTRTIGGVQCQYYRLNSRIPKINSEGLLDLGPFTEGELRNDKVVSKHTYPLEGGVRYKICEIKCRDRAVPLSERFPEEVVYGRHPWILPEHRNDENTKLAADRRIRQRLDYLAGTCNAAPVSKF